MIFEIIHPEANPALTVLKEVKPYDATDLMDLMIRCGWHNFYLANLNGYENGIIFHPTPAAGA